MLFFMNKYQLHRASENDCARSGSLCLITEYSVALKKSLFIHRITISSVIRKKLYRYKR